MPAKSLAETKRFYGEVFGWGFTDWGSQYVSFEDGRLSGGFYQSDTVQRGTLLVVVFALDLEAAEQRIRAAGGTIVKPVYSFPGGRRFHFQDPSGNELAVWSDR
jgi:hypothetical protein